MKIHHIDFLNWDDVENRQIKFTLDNGTVITAESCCESWQQWGGTREELYVTMPHCKQYNAWLHGTDLKD